MLPDCTCQLYSSRFGFAMVLILIPFLSNVENAIHTILYAFSPLKPAKETFEMREKERLNFYLSMLPLLG